jgi:hypothetical protein
MPYLWSAHAMLAPEEGAHILLPPECTEATVAASHSGRIGKYGDHITWPNWTDAQGKRHNLSLVQSPHSDDVAAYSFIRPLSHGACDLHWPKINRTFMLSFPVDVVPFLTVLVGEGLKTDPPFFRSSRARVPRLLAGSMRRRRTHTLVKCPRVGLGSGIWISRHTSPGLRFARKTV